METPKVNLKKIEKQAREAAFSTEDHTKNETPSILQGYKNEFNIARQKCSDKIQTKIKDFEKVISKWDSVSDPTFIKKQLEEKTGDFLNFNPETYRSGIKTKYDFFKKRDSNYDDFKRQHNRTLEPVRVDKQKFAWYVVFALLIIEVVANYYLFREVTGSNTEAGRNTAWVLSGSQSFANVISGFLVGKLLWAKVLYAQSGFKKFLAFILSSTHLIFIIWMNLAIGLWRAIITVNAQGGDQLSQFAAMDPFSNFLYFQGEMPAVLVSVVGLVFALIAYLDGWFSDEPYPQYGDRFREVNKANTKLEIAKKTLYDKWNTVIETYDKLSTQFVKNAGRELDNWNDAINSLEKEFTDWTADLLAAEKSYALICETYETTFNKAQDSKEKKISIPREGLWDKSQKDPFIVFSDGAHHHHNDKDRIAKFKKLKTEYNANFEKVTADWNKHKKEMTLTIDKLVKEYAS
jgi:hypothetical protein